MNLAKPSFSGLCLWVKKREHSANQPDSQLNQKRRRGEAFALVVIVYMLSTLTAQALSQDYSNAKRDHLIINSEVSLVADRVKSIKQAEESLIGGISEQYFIKRNAPDELRLFVDEGVDAFNKLKALAKTELSNGSARSNDSFHLFSHGRPGALLVNTQWLEGKELAAHIKQLIGSAKHLNIYGCDFARGQQGQQALDALAKALNISISGSSDKTGVDGNWSLEVVSDSQQTHTSDELALTDYQHSLQVVGISKQIVQDLNNSNLDTTVIPNTILTGANFRYALNISCVSGDCNDVVVTDQLPAQMVFAGEDTVVGLNAGQTVSQATNGGLTTVTFNLGSLSAGFSGSISFAARLQNGVISSGRDFDNQATIISSNADTAVSVPVVIRSETTPAFFTIKTGIDPAFLENPGRATYAVPIDSVTFEFRASLRVSCGAINSRRLIFEDDFTQQPWFTPTAATLALPGVSWIVTPATPPATLPTRIFRVDLGLETDNNLTVLNPNAPCDRLFSFVGIDREYEFSLDEALLNFSEAGGTSTSELPNTLVLQVTDISDGISSYSGVLDLIFLQQRVQVSGNKVALGAQLVTRIGDQLRAYRMRIDNEGTGNVDGVFIDDDLPINEADIIGYRVFRTGTDDCSSYDVAYITNTAYLPGATGMLGARPSETDSRWVEDLTQSNCASALSVSEFDFLPTGQFITALRLRANDIIPNGGVEIEVGIRTRVVFRDGTAPISSSTARHCARNGIASSLSAPVNFGEGSCATFGYGREFVSIGIRVRRPSLIGATDGRLDPGDQIQYELIALDDSDFDTYYNRMNGSAPPRGNVDVSSIVMSSLLSPGLSFVPGSSVFSLAFDNPGITAPTPEVIPNFNGTGRELVRWTVPENIEPILRNTADSSQRFSFGIIFRALAGNDIPAGTSSVVSEFHSGVIERGGQLQVPGQRGLCTFRRDLSDIDGDGVVNDIICIETASINGPVAAPAALVAKRVRGDLDSEFSLSGAASANGGSADYQIIFSNTGTEPLRDIVLYDILPAVGDTRAVAPSVMRNSAFTETFNSTNFIDESSLPPGSTILYNRSSNPCRTELRPQGSTQSPWPLGCDDNWQEPADFGVANIAQVRAIQVRVADSLDADFDLALSPLPVAIAIEVDYSVRTPTLAITDAIVANCRTSRNSVAFVASGVVGGNNLLPSESADTLGLSFCVPAVDLSKTVVSSEVEADGSVTVVYNVTATNTSLATGGYDVIEDFRPGTGASLNQALVAYDTAQADGLQGMITTPLTADGIAVLGEIVAAGASESFVITANYSIDRSAVTQASANCAAEVTEADQTGFSNGVTGSTSDTNLANNVTCAPIPPPQQPGLEVEKTLTIGGSTAEAGESLTYSIAIRNTGAAAAVLAAGSVSESVPANTTASFSPAASNNGISGDFICVVAAANSACSNTLALTIAAGATETLTFNVMVVNPLPSAVSNIVNTVAVPGVDCDDTLINTCSVTTPTPADISLIKEVGAATGNANGTFDASYSMLVTNNGNQDLTDLVLVDDLTAQFGAVFTASNDTDVTNGITIAPTVSVVSDVGSTPIVLPQGNSTYTGGGNNTNLFTTRASTLGAGDSIRVVFSVRFNSRTVSDPLTYTNTATATGTTSSNAIVTDSDAAIVNAPAGNADISISKVLSGPPISLGSGVYRVIYDLTVRNDGNLNLLNLQIDDDLVAMINRPQLNNAIASNANVTFVSGTTLTPSGRYTGTGENSLLVGTNSFPVGASSVLQLSFNFTPDVYFGPFMNVVEVEGFDPSNVRLTDDSGSPFAVNVPSTPITLAWFSSKLNTQETVDLVWQTASEVGNAGFTLYALDEQGSRSALVNGMLPSNGDSDGPQQYRFSTDVAATSYLLIDHSVLGNITEHGPFGLGTTFGLPVTEKMIDWQKVKQESELKRVEREQQHKRELQQRLERLKQGSPKALKPTSKRQSVFNRIGQVAVSLAISAIHLVVPPADAANLVSFELDTPGLYVVTHQDLVQSGLDLSGVSLSRIGLKEGGVLWPMMVESNGSAVFTSSSSIVFPARGMDTLYSGVNKYTLVLDEGQRLIEEDARGLPNDVAFASSYFGEKRYAPQNNYSFLSPEDDDPWYADNLQAYDSDAVKIVRFSVDDYLPSLSGFGGFGSHLTREPTKNPELQVTVWGGADLPGNGLIQPDHHVVVSNASRMLSEMRFDGLRSENATIMLASIDNGVNTFTVTVPQTNDFLFDLVRLDEITLRYPRAFKSVNGELVYDSSWNKFRVTGLPPANALVVRVDQAGNAFAMTNRGDSDCGSDCIYFAGGDSNQQNSYFVASASSKRSPTIVPAMDDADIPQEPANYLVIAHPDFIGTTNGALESYVAELESSYGSAAIVSVDNIYTKHSGGVLDPQAIKAFISDAYQNLGTRHVLLVGGDNYDYRNFTNTGGQSFIPSIYVPIANNVRSVPSDASYVLIDDDLIPDLTIARLPVRNTDDLTDLIAKRYAYLARTNRDTVLIAADKVDRSSYSFKDVANDLLVKHFSSNSQTTSFLDDQSREQSGTTIVNAFNAGVTLAAYFGHSSADRWSISNMFEGDDVSRLSNFSSPAVVTQWGCWNTYYSSPTSESLANRLLLDGQQGAVTVMGATSFTQADAEQRMADLLFANLQQGQRIGDAVLAAKLSLGAQTPHQLDVLLGWAVLGFDDMAVFE